LLMLSFPTRANEAVPYTVRLGAVENREHAPPSLQTCGSGGFLNGAFFGVQR